MMVDASTRLAEGGQAAAGRGRYFSGQMCVWDLRATTLGREESGGQAEGQEGEDDSRTNST